MTRPANIVVCAVDFTPASDRALAWAAAFARRWEAQLEIVHVLQPISVGIEAQATDAGAFEKARLEAAQQRLGETAQAIAAESGVAARAQVLGGDPATIICRLGADDRARMIVVGSQGRGALGRWVLGSVAERVLRAAAVPVAVVPPPPADRPDPVLARRAGEARRVRVLAGLASNAADARVVEMVAELRRGWPSEVLFLHLYWPQEQLARLGLPGPRDLLAADKDIVADLEPPLRRVIGPLAAEPDVRLAVRPAWGAPAANLLTAARQEDADLIVIGAEERFGLARILHPSVAAALAHQNRSTPVVFVPAGGQAAAEAGPARTPLFRAVLAPTDLSPAGNAAVRHAYALLRGRGGVVELCHIHAHGLPSPPGAYDDVRLHLPAERRAEIERQLRALIPADADSLGITTHVSVFEGGETATAIVQAAERLHVDAITMGSHGRSGVSRALLGSVVEKVVRHTARPVLVVRAAE